MNHEKPDNLMYEFMLTKIGDYVATEIEEVATVNYLDKEMGYMFVINTNDGKEMILSLI